MNSTFFPEEGIVHDVTLPMRSGMTVWPGDPEVTIQPAASIAAGDGCNVARYEFGSHTGTHLDAPRHFYEDGQALEAIPLSLLNGRCFVADLTGVSDTICTVDLERAGLPSNLRRILLKTRNSELWENPCHIFREDFVDLSLEAADYLLSLRLGLVGIDYLSIENPHRSQYPAHQKLLSHSVPLLEGLDLREVSPGEYTLCCLPLRALNGDGAPARVLLWK